MDVPLPWGVKVIAPVGVPRESAAFSGKWQGVWDETLASILVVEEITGNEAKVVYAWGNAPAWRITSGFAEIKGTFEGSPLALVVRLPRPATAVYQMRPDGKLDATYTMGSSSVMRPDGKLDAALIRRGSRAVFTRVEEQR